MASEITNEPTVEGSIGLNHAPEESRSGSDMPENSMQRRPVMIIYDLPEGAMEQLQQIFMAQTNPQVLQPKDCQDTSGDTPRAHLRMTPQEDGGVRGTDMLPRRKLCRKVVKDFKECLRYHDSNKLLEMVNQFPAQLFLNTVNTKFSRSALHVAVLESSQTLIHALLKELEKWGRSAGKDSEMLVQNFMLKVDEFGLSAADMVALIGNEEILSHFGKILEFKIPDLEVLFYGATNLFQCSEDEKRNLLENASPLLDKQAPASIHEGVGQLSLREWLLKENIDFVYCLHEASRDRNYSQQKVRKFVKHVFDNGDSSFLEPLLNVRDKLGRSPLHIYTCEWMQDIIPFLTSLVAHFPNLDLNMRDFSGMTPLHWAAAQGFENIVTFLTSQEQTNLNAMYGNLCGWKIKKITNFNVDDVGDVTPLHLAVIHNHVEVVEALLKVPEGRGLNVNAICMRKLQFSNEILDEGIWYWTPFQLAAYMGHEKILQVLLKDPRLYDPGLKKMKKSAPTKHNMIPSLHLATSQFHHFAVEALVKVQSMDTLVKDKQRNTALHYATMHAHGQLQIHANLHDYVTVSHFTSKPPKSRKPSDHDIITCMDILTHSVLDVEQKNKNGVAPTLQSSWSQDVQKWWLNNIAQEAEDNKKDLIMAANSVSVIATLVAASSFVGPLQPPLGLSDDGNPTWLDGYSHVKHTSVEVFFFCNSLSFYFAIAAIMFAMLPPWPIPREWHLQEGRIARRCVHIAVLFLFGSIIFIICAFSAANIAIVPNKRWRYKTTVVISISFGVLVCFIILFLSFMRLLTLISSKNGLARKISNFGIRTILWEHNTSISSRNEIARKISNFGIRTILWEHNTSISSRNEIAKKIPNVNTDYAMGARYIFC